MKLVRFGKPGREKPGIIDEEGQIRDLSTKLKDIDSKAISSNSLKQHEDVKFDCRLCHFKV